MTASDWAELVRHCKPVSNVNLVCRDGVVYSHKIVLASVSDFVKTLLSDIPVGDDVSVFLPDFSKEEVNKLQENILLKRRSDNYDLCAVLHYFQSEIVKDLIASAQERTGEVFVKEEIDDSCEKENVNDDKISLETKELFKSSPVKMEVEATEFFMTEQNHAEPQPDDFETTKYPLQKKGKKKSEYSEFTPPERHKMYSRKWRARNPDLVKMKNLKSYLNVKERRKKDPEYDAMMRARQAERVRRSRALKKAAEQLALLEAESTELNNETKED